MKNKSSSRSILLVACLPKASIASSLSIPIPLSVTLILSNPPLISSIRISVALASMLFSTSSFTILEHLSTTSPAEILFAKASLITCILLILYLTNIASNFYIRSTYINFCRHLNINKTYSG